MILLGKKKILWFDWMKEKALTLAGGVATNNRDVLVIHQCSSSSS